METVEADDVVFKNQQLTRNMHLLTPPLYMCARTNPEGVPFPSSSREGRLAGQPLCPGPDGGWFAVLFALKGDLEWVHSSLGLESPVGRSPCALCRANAQEDGIPWTDSRRDALWLQHQWMTNSEWHASRTPGLLNPLFSLPGAHANVWVLTLTC